MESKNGGVTLPVRVVNGFSTRGVTRGRVSTIGQREVQGSRCSQLMVELLPIMAMAWNVGQTLRGIRSGHFYYPPGRVSHSQTPILRQSDGVDAELG